MLPGDDLSNHFPSNPSFTDLEAFFTAAKNGDTATVGRLLDDYGAAAIINARDSINARPITWAACNGHLDVVELLLDRGAAIDAKGTAGKAALCWAAEMGKPDIAALLLARGASLEDRDDSGLTALDYAQRQGRHDIAGMIEEQAEARRLAQQLKIEEKEEAEVRNLTQERLEKLKKSRPQNLKLSPRPAVNRPGSVQPGHSQPGGDAPAKDKPRKAGPAPRHPHPGR